MRLLSRNRTALLLTVIYSLIILTPLAPLALRSATIAHAVTGECAGDCAICGCSPEHSANRTCCCWKKKQQGCHGHEDDQTADCCKKNKPESKPVLSCGWPCGGNKQRALLDATGFELLPYHFGESIPAFQREGSSPLHNTRLTDHQDEPPDPPPKLISA
ncbi:MAG: hypothetical protein A2X79_07430 [Desulfuromonadaceae bacterium GWB2_53_15]|nr:MAG: hypothetical protein A2X83_05555 [Desulfuromonadales bacterium GWD2_54_10]OHB26352.1 MAG: hypothetical protein A2X79_07430 [Desulfuromonadaceae bacterium GWB2_53_15]